MRAYLVFVLLLVTSQNISAQNNDWVWQSIGLDRNFEPLKQKRQLTIAVIDDAFDIDHPGIKPYLYQNKKEIPQNGIDDDKNGKVDDFTGWDFSDNDSDVRPPSNNVSRFSHGTKVAGILIQTIEKLTDKAGLIKILPIKTSSDSKQSNYIINGYEGIKHALELKADIIVCSWSGGNLPVEHENILKQAEKTGVIIVASAGNFLSEKEQMPAAFPWCINVTAINKLSRKVSIANYGRFVDISAPGDSLCTIQPKTIGYTGTLSGTSASAPIIAGIIASFSSAYPKVKAQEWDIILKNAAIPIDSYNPLYVGKLGAGIPDVYRIKSHIEGGRRVSTTNMKGYLDLRLENQITIPYKVPSIKLLQINAGKDSHKTKLKMWQDGLQKDSTVSLKTPVYFQADSFKIYPSSKKQLWTYYESQVIDSSYLYCSGIVEIKASRGIIEDGSGNEDYAGRSDCKWKIEVPGNKRIKIWFEYFDTEPKADQVYIFNGHGTEAPILAIFSGPNVPPQIISWENKVLVWFVSNETTHAKGWKMHFEEVDE